MSGNIKKIVEPNSGIDYSLEKDFKIFTLSKELPITTYPSYIRLGIVIYCVKGNAKIDIYSNKHIITPKELIIILPGQLVALTDVSVDFQIRYFTITESFYTDILSGISRFSPHFFFYMRQHYYFKMEDVETLSFVDFFELLIRKAVDPENQYRRESVILSLRILFLDIYNHYKVNSLDSTATIDVHKKELTHKFFQLVMSNYKVNRSVTFYANSLCITPKYLTMVVKEVSGKSAKDWIAVLFWAAISTRHAMTMKCWTGISVSIPTRGFSPCRKEAEKEVYRQKPLISAAGSRNCGGTSSTRYGSCSMLTA